MANLSPDSGNLKNFEGLWLQTFWFGYLAIVWKLLAPKCFVWRKILTYNFFSKVFSQNVLQCHFYVCPVYLHVLAFIYIYKVTAWKLADGLKIRDIKWKCDSFDTRSMVLNISYEICLQNVEIEHLEIFAKCWKPIRFLVKSKAKNERAVNDWNPV